MSALGVVRMCCRFGERSRQSGAASRPGIGRRPDDKLATHLAGHPIIPSLGAAATRMTDSPEFVAFLDSRGTTPNRHITRTSARKRNTDDGSQ